MTKWGIDLDGILVSFYPRMREILNTLFHLELPEDFVPTDWNWGNAGVESHIMAEVMTDAWKVIKSTPNFWEDLLPTNHIFTMANWFHENAEHNAEVFFITARVETAGRNTRLQSENWLREYLGNPKQSINVLVTGSGLLKKNILEAINIVRFIDDHAPSVREASKVLTCKSVVLDQPWNRNDREGLHVVHSLAEFLKD